MKTPARYVAISQQYFGYLPTNTRMYLGKPTAKNLSLICIRIPTDCVETPINLWNVWRLKTEVY